MSGAFAVFVHDTLVGHLLEEEHETIRFRTAATYREMDGRPVLSQSLEDDLTRDRRAKHPRELPAFFANLAPEGPLRELICRTFNVADGDELGLLATVAQDLPGAVDVRPVEEPPIETAITFVTESGSVSDSEEQGLRFSLAGVQLKFSALREGHRLVLPTRGRRGEWIVKFDTGRFADVAENEFTMMEWARAAGFDVPECHLHAAEDLDGLPRRHAPAGTRVFVIRRYDRTPAGRIHQEDFAQVVGLQPRLKYEQRTYEQLAAIVLAIVGEAGYREFIRRLTLMVAVGNGDAHLKNWALIYPDRVHAALAPVYDQVATVAWPDVDRTLGLKLAGVKQIVRVDGEAFRRLAERVGSDPTTTLRIVAETLEQLAQAWREHGGGLPLPRAHRDSLRELWSRAPLLQATTSPFD